MNFLSRLLATVFVAVELYGDEPRVFDRLPSRFESDDKSALLARFRDIVSYKGPRIDRGGLEVVRRLRAITAARLPEHQIAGLSQVEVRTNGLDQKTAIYAIAEDGKAVELWLHLELANGSVEGWPLAQLVFASLRGSATGQVGIGLFLKTVDSTRTRCWTISAPSVFGSEFVTESDMFPVLYPGRRSRQGLTYWPVVIGPKGRGRFVDLFVVVTDGTKVSSINLEQYDSVDSWECADGARLDLKLVNGETRRVLFDEVTDSLIRDFVNATPVQESVAPLPDR